MAFNVKTFYTRATTALVFVALLLGCVWYSYYSFVAFFAVVGFIGLYEFYKISEKLNSRPHKVVGYILFILAMGLHLVFTYKMKLHHENYDGYNEYDDEIFYSYSTMIMIFFLLTPFVLLIIELFRSKHNFSNIAYTLISIAYVVLPIVLLVLLCHRRNIFDPNKVLGMIFFVWINDTGAYFVGSFFGKHKLYEKISPNKTWEGTLGGIAFCIGLSFVVAQIFPQLAQIHWLAISIIVAVFGNLGDLVESMLKRQAGVKDSGTLMPGHGGVLDRFDSLFFATPFVFCYLALMGLL